MATLSLAQQIKLFFGRLDVTPLNPLIKTILTDMYGCCNTTNYYSFATIINYYYYQSTAAPIPLILFFFVFFLILDGDCSQLCTAAPTLIERADNNS